VSSASSPMHFPAVPSLPTAAHGGVPPLLGRTL
jgi:hypothetical protein